MKKIKFYILRKFVVVASEFLPESSEHYIREAFCIYSISFTFRRNDYFIRSPENIYQDTI